MKNILLVGIVVISIGGLFWFANLLTENDSNVIATRGIHWHPQLVIYVNGEKEEIPANIGLVGGHMPIHTHVEDVKDGVLHLEFGEVVTTDDIRLHVFFDIWGKDIETAFGTLEKMVVNGEESKEYGTHVLQEDGKIELFYTRTDAAE